MTGPLPGPRGVLRDIPRKESFMGPKSRAARRYDRTVSRPPLQVHSYLGGSKCRSERLQSQ